MIQLLLLLSLAAASPQKIEKKRVQSSSIPTKREFPLNTAANPCENFHQYVCSEAEASFKLRSDRRIHTFAFNDSRERLLEENKKFMLSLRTAKDLSPRTQQVRDFYLSCMNAPEKAKSEKTAVTEIVKDLDKISSTQELVAYSHNGISEGKNDLAALYPTPNADDPLKLDASLFVSFMLLPDHKYYAQDDLIKDYKKILVQFLKNVYPKIKKADAENRAQAMIDLQKDFIKVYPEMAVRRQRWSEKRLTSQSDILKKYPQLQLDLLLNKVPKNVQIRTTIPEALEFLNSEISARPLQVWKDIYLYKLVDDLMDDAYPKYFKQNFNFSKKYFGGSEKRPDRQERCTTTTANYFLKEIDAAQVEKIFPHFDETKINEVAAKIRQSIVDGLQKNTWLSRDGKKEAIKKITSARLQLVKPHNDKEWDFVPLRKYSANDFVKNMITYSGARWEKNLQSFNEPTNQDAWGMGPLTVNAYYNASENKFVLPIGILQFPFYDKDGSLVENLGAVGAVIGHELGHSIDDNGSKYDSQGRLKQWMTTKDVMEFNLRGQKMIDQFNEAGHDGKLTLGENVADLVGLTFAYNAAFPKGEGANEDKKKFFISYARTWCTVARPDFEQLLRKTDTHSAGWARINEQVKHQPAFAETFQCKPGDPMTLPTEKRVQIW